MQSEPFLAREGLVSTICSKSCLSIEFKVLTFAARYVNNGSGCKSCPAGYYLDLVGLGKCMHCDGGRFSRLFATNCSFCTLGRYSNSNRTSCLACTRGKFANQFKCGVCAPGRFSLDESSICTLCRHGFFASSSEQTACSACQGGSASNGTNCEQCRRVSLKQASCS